MTRGKSAANQGLTVIELVVVVSLIAIMSAISATAFNLSGWLEKYRLKGSARTLFLNMQKARMNAVRENRDWAIKFNTGSSSYQFQRKNDGGSWTNDGDSIPLGEDVAYGHGSATHDATDEKKAFSSDVTFAADRATFNPIGLPTKNGYCYLANNSGESFVVGTNTVGSIKIKQWNGNDWE